MRKKQTQLKDNIFTCVVCKSRYFDWNEQVTGTPTIKCMWCSKYSKVAPKDTKEIK